MSPEKLKILHLLEERDAARSHLAAFAEYTLDVVPSLHHRMICNAIDELWDPVDPYDELIVLAPPGSAKSTYTSIALPPYFMGRFPKSHVLTASYSTELAEKWGRRVRGIVSSPRFQTLYNLKLSQDSTAAGRWANSKGGEFYGAGVGSGILGFRADLAIIDDPISGFEQAQSLTQLQKMHGWYETDFVTRLKPQAKLVLICQRLARHDLAGYLIDRNLANPTRRQRILRLPMEAGENDPLGRSPGDRLWPEWYTAEMVEDAKRDDFKWRTLYQQEPPSDDGSWVTPDEIKLVDIIPTELTYYVLSDLALSVNTGDYSVHLTVGIDETGHAFVVDAWRDRVSPEVTAEKHIELCTTYKPAECLIDDDNAAKVYVQLLATEARRTSTNVPWKTMPMRGQNKETRAAATRGMFKRGKISLHRAPWNAWLVKELLTFPNAVGQGVDDGVDALSLLGRRLTALSHPNVIPIRPRQKYANEITMDEAWECQVKMGRRV